MEIDKTVLSDIFSYVSFYFFVLFLTLQIKFELPLKSFVSVPLASKELWLTL